MKFVTHEAIGSGVFNRGFCSASPLQSHWAEHLTNDLRVLGTLLQRMESDFLATNIKLRKPWGAKDVVPGSGLVCL